MSSLAETMDTHWLRTTDDVVRARQVVRNRAVELGYSIVDQTKLITAASELARNAVVHGGGGEMFVEMVDDGSRQGLRLHFVDQGPGIPDMELALRDGYTSGRGLGHGLGGAKRLVNEFQIESRVGEGTRITITKWK
jgi:serine/threonine-protein kinase RsbT